MNKHFGDFLKSETWLWQYHMTKREQFFFFSRIAFLLNKAVPWFESICHSGNRTVGQFKNGLTNMLSQY